MNDHPIIVWLGENPDWSKSKLAEAAGCHASRITQLLQGDTPSAQLAFKIEQITGIDARVLLRISPEAAE